MHPELNLAYRTVDNIIYYIEEKRGHKPTILAHKYKQRYTQPPLHTILYTFNDTFYTLNLEHSEFVKLKKGFLKGMLNKL